MNEARFTGPIGGSCPRMREPVHAHLDRAKSLHGVDFESARHEDALRVARAYVVAHAFRQSRVTESYSPLVVIELHVVCQQAVELPQVAMVVSLKKLPVEFADGRLQLRFGLDFLERADFFLGRRSRARPAKDRHGRPSHRERCHHRLLESWSQGALPLASPIIYDARRGKVPELASVSIPVTPG